MMTDDEILKLGITLDQDEIVSRENRATAWLAANVTDALVAALDFTDEKLAEETAKVLSNYRVVRVEDAGFWWDGPVGAPTFVSWENVP